MTNDQLEDLKQFIDSRISQSEALTERKLESMDVRLGSVENRLGSVENRLGSVEHRLGSVEQNLESLRDEMLGGFAGVGEAIDEINSRIDEHLIQLHKQPV